MRVHSTQLAEFVPGWWSVPQNPITGGMGSLADFVPGAFAVPQTPIALSGLSEFVGGKFVVPQNPVLDAAGLSGCGGSCGCGGKCRGMGDISTTISDAWTSLQSPIQAPAWITLGAFGVLGIMYVFAGSGKRRGRR